MQSRLTELEIKLSFTEHLVEELNRSVYEQQRQIDALMREVIKLREQQTAPETLEEKYSLRDEAPPHY